MKFEKASRQQVRIKLAVAGPSGSGKTLGALALAKALSSDGRIALVDTENGSASLYGDRFDFDVLNLEPPFTSKRYLEAMQAAIDAGYSVLVIDSLSHQWQGEGGILARKEEADKRGGNSYTNWATYTKEHTEFVSKLLHLPVHIVATLRSKQDYVLETNERGKQVPKKVGMAPVQREGLEYEFSTVFDVDMSHRATASKDRTGLFAENAVDLLNPETGKALLKWLASGAPLVEKPVEQVVEQPPAQDRADEDKMWRGKRLGDYSTNDLEGFVVRYKDDARMATFVKSCRNVVADRALGNDTDSRVARMKAEVEKEEAELPFGDVPGAKAKPTRITD